MNKAELVQAVAERTGSSPADARKHVEAVLDSIVTGVAEGDRVALLGFGTFEPTTRAARTARNPQTGVAIDVPAAVVPRFRTGAAFKARVAENGSAPSGTTSKPSRTKDAKAAAPKTEKSDKKSGAKASPKTTKAKDAKAKEVRGKDAKASSAKGSAKGSDKKSGKSSGKKSKKGKK